MKRIALKTMLAFVTRRANATSRGTDIIFGDYFSRTVRRIQPCGKTSVIALSARRSATL